MWPERARRCGACRRSGLLLQDLVDDEFLSEQTLPLIRLDRRAPEFRITNHHDCEAFAFLGIRIRRDDGVLNRNERRKQLPDLLDLGTRLEVSHIDFEHGHRNLSQKCSRQQRPPTARRVRRSRKPLRQSARALSIRPMQLSSGISCGPQDNRFLLGFFAPPGSAEGPL